MGQQCGDRRVLGTIRARSRTLASIFAPCASEASAPTAISTFSSVTAPPRPPTPRLPTIYGMACLRLQGMSAGPSGALWLSLSQIGPGGFIERGASLLEKHYVVLAGEVTVVTDDGEAVFGLWDSVRLAVSSP